MTRHPASEATTSEATPTDSLTASAPAKRGLRQELRSRRARLAAAAAPDAAECAARGLMRLLAGMPDSTLAGYWPMGDEFDVRPALAAALSRGWSCALPVVVGRDAPLVFRSWRPGDGLERGGFGTLVPHRDRPEIVPRVVLVPLLGFDARGFRIGYGGGYYDHSLARLRALGDIDAIGIAFAGQEIEAVPTDGFDQGLDALVTEAGLRRFTREPA